MSALVINITRMVISKCDFLQHTITILTLIVEPILKS